MRKQIDDKMFTPFISIKTDLILEVKGTVRAELIIGG